MKRQRHGHPTNRPGKLVGGVGELPLVLGRNFGATEGRSNSGRTTGVHLGTPETRLFGADLGDLKSSQFHMHPWQNV
jgi:hypothetical protein